MNKDAWDSFTNVEVVTAVIAEVEATSSIVALYDNSRLLLLLHSFHLLPACLSDLSECSELLLLIGSSQASTRFGIKSIWPLWRTFWKSLHSQGCGRRKALGCALSSPNDTVCAITFFRSHNCFWSLITRRYLHFTGFLRLFGICDRLFNFLRFL